MLTIALGCFLAGILLFIGILKQKKLYKKVTCIVLGIAILLISIILGLFVPLQGMEEKTTLVNEINLCELDEQNEQKIFVWKDVSYAYLYKYKDEDNIIYDYAIGDVTVLENDDCKTPVLLEYKREPKVGIWSFARKCSKIEYVFIIPRNSIMNKK